MIFLAAVVSVAGCDSGGDSNEGTLEVVDLIDGDGAPVELGQTLMVSYVGTLEDGTVFDSTEERGEPWIFTLVPGQVIEGWLEGLVGIKEGGRRRLTIPAHLAFGRQGRCLGDGSCLVPPNSIVVYDITVLSIIEDVIIEVIAEGTGEVAYNGKALLVDYTGTFLDGRVFDSTGISGQPFGFVLGLGRVIAGWDQGLAGMKVGGIRDLTIPPHLAYGAQGRPGAIPPYATLKFRVELLALTSQ